MGKGLEISIIVELLFYVSASLIPLALPLAILLSSIMTFGNLAENNELTALKASGMSLYRIVRPLFSVVIIIAMGTFYFANYVIPVANLKWHSLIFDIQNTKISTVLTPGVYSSELDGYVIKVDEGEGNQFKGVLIHDHTTPNEINTIRAESGKIYKSKNGAYLFFEMTDGTVHRELEPQTPNFSEDGINHSIHSNHPVWKSKFETMVYKININGFDLERSREELMRDKHEMLNVFQINDAMDSIKANGEKVLNNFLMNIKSGHTYFESHTYINHSIKEVENKNEFEVLDYAVNFKDVSYNKKVKAINKAQTTVRRLGKNVEGQRDYMVALERDMDNYMIEFNRKFALTAAIIILFFIGAPLGAIVSKGGFGAPVVIAALLFMIYFVLLTVGDNMAEAATVTPIVGMWFSSFILAPVAVWMMYSAANDLPINSSEYWGKLMGKIWKPFRFKRS
jgi:lipopolysaccharide export system permease protein